MPAAPNFAELMWAPWLRATDVMMSPGSRSAKYTAMFATVPLIHVPHSEELLGEGHDSVLDLVDEDVPLVVPLVREAFGVPVSEIREQHLARHRTDHVLGRDHREGLREPRMMAVHLFVDEDDVFVHPRPDRNRRGG